MINTIFISENDYFDGIKEVFPGKRIIIKKNSKKTQILKCLYCGNEQRFIMFPTYRCESEISFLNGDVIINPVRLGSLNLKEPVPFASEIDHGEVIYDENDECECLLDYTDPNGGVFYCSECDSAVFFYEYNPKVCSEISERPCLGCLYCEDVADPEVVLKRCLDICIESGQHCHSKKCINCDNHYARVRAKVSINDVNFIYDKMISISHDK